MSDNNRSQLSNIRLAMRHRADPGWMKEFQEIKCIGITAYARSENLCCDDGSSRPFKVVPFHYLAEDPENRRITLLPELRTRQDIRNLDDDQLNSYLAGYRLGHLCRASRKAKLIGLCKHIGCRPAVCE
ncbi:hypothetical protein EDD85DRAFT_939164 [Armillaria nabsnona]|nr:hypothetical protein EDD85DRAFT_939164 [Armillaria nabsnona]